MKNVWRFLWMIAAFTCLSACSDVLDKRVDACLEFAGDNRAELEKVLSHYKDEPQKLQAAKFLIASRA